MKKIIPLILLVTLFSSVLSAQSVKIKKDPVGKWTFDAPYAPYGYTTGAVDIGFEDQEYSVKMSFTEIGYSFEGENITVRNDSIFFDVWIEGNSVSNTLKIEDDTTITGIAVYFEGTVPYTMKKYLEKEE